MADLASLVQEKRERDGIGLRAAAAACGVSPSTLSRIERGFDPTAKNDRIVRAWLSGETAQLPQPPMTLRDWFAGQALIGLVVNFPQMDDVPGMTGEQVLAAQSYEIANAMLAERERSNGR